MTKQVTSVKKQTITWYYITFKDDSYLYRFSPDDGHWEILGSSGTWATLHKNKEVNQALTVYRKENT